MATGSRGRPRKPDALKRLEGTARADRKIENTAEPSGMPKRPSVLSAEAVAIWDDLAPKLSALGLLSEVDESTFAVYCQAYGDWKEMTELLNDLGVAAWYSESESGYRQIIPEVTARDKAFQAMQKMAGRFGLDPSSRSGISVGTEARIASSAEEFLFASPKVMP